MKKLEELFRDSQISEIMINAVESGESYGVWVERAGVLELTSLELDELDIQRLVEKILGPLGLRVDRMSPSVDARMADGSRVHIVVPPLAVEGTHITIRRFLPRKLGLLNFLADGLPGSLDENGIASLLKWSVRARANIVVSGGTSSGKTTLLNVLVNVLAADLQERIITIEDTAELAISTGHILRLETRQANAEGVGRITQRDLLKNALRMRPDRILVGEVRGSEALDMLQAMNTGNDGSLTTCHSNGPEDTLARLETMVLMANLGLEAAAVRRQILSALDLIIHLKRLNTGKRVIDVIAEVSPQRGLQILAEGSELKRLPEFPPRDSSAGLPKEIWLEPIKAELNENLNERNLNKTGVVWE